MPRGFQPMRDLPLVGWLAALVVITLVHPWVPAPRWLMLHLLLLGAVTHAILVWSTHFADTLLHRGPDGREHRQQTTRLVLHNAGALAVVAGILTSTWPATLAGATSVAGAVTWHGVALLQRLRSSLPSRFSGVVRYYIAAACFLPVGAALGVTLAWGLTDPVHEQVKLAHVVVNLLGWMGLTVVGTVVTLWPTILRTRMATGAERAAARALPVLAVGVAVAATGALAGSLPVAAAGVAAYFVGLVFVAPPFVDAARRKPPTSYAAWSLLAGCAWLVVLLAGLVMALGTAAGWSQAADRLSWGVPLVAAGFAAQLLLGALSYLVPVALGGGPTPVRAATAVLDRGSALRITAANAGLVLLALPAPSVVRVLASLVVLAALAAFLPLLVLGIRASHRAKRAGIAGSAGSAGSAGTNAASSHPDADPRARGVVRTERPEGQLRGLAAAGLAAVVIAVAAGVALDPLALDGRGADAAAAGIAATGETTTVRVEARDMRFHPGTVEVPAGNRLVIDLVNTDDEDVHDLVLDSGDRTSRLAPGDSERLDLGVVGRDLEGWCSVVGHRQMGMVLQVDVTGATDGRTSRSAAGDADAPQHGAHEGHHEPGEAADDAPLDLMAEPAPGFRPHDATLPPLTDRNVHKVTLTVGEVEREVAPGVTQQLWTYNGTAPGPVLHGRVGDVFEVTLVNDGSIGHSIDFHAGALAPDRPMRTIEPGESLVYRFTAERAGIWMYHCSSMPMSAHIANGMYGAVVIEPPGLPEVDRSYLLVQGEYYLGAQGSTVDVDALQAEEPDAVVFNGYVSQYAHRPLPARTGERVRVWVLDAGPNRASSFHVVGGQFDTVYAEGAYLLGPRSRTGGAQALALSPGQGGFVELTFPEAGSYPFVSHIMVDAERGARGLFRIRDR